MGNSGEPVISKIDELNIQKPIFTYIVSMYAPNSRHRGHARAIVSGGMGTAKSKAALLGAT